MPAPQVLDPHDLLHRLTDASPAMVTDLERLVRAESPSVDGDALSACRAVLAEIGTRLLGAAPTVLPNDPGNGRPGGLLWQLGPADTQPVLLVGHFDTVFPKGTLKHRPFLVDGDRATGPGVFDMKAGLIQGLYAVACLRELTGEDPAVAFLVTADEEIGSPAGGRIVTEWARQSRAALVLEGAADGGGLKHARKGWSFYDIRVKGIAAHAGLEPDKGCNALSDLARIIVALESLAAQDDRVTVTPTLASAGTTQNTVPDRAHVTVDVRVPDVRTQQEIDTELHRVVTEAARLPFEITGGPNRPPLEEASATDLLATARTCLDELGLAWPGSAAVGGISDGNLCAAAGTPTLDGLGAVGGGPHADHEWADVPRMPERAALVALMVERLGKRAAR
ncbi:M20/M25/M40 family metallo-hydrolase [Streptomyces sp. NPDC051453]|uniref:M20/M25/M40 family metallo-hydrolase n=1 Tax=Streptomyces sp. NPDC051453 TaxID=3154941 RepID=UPI00343CF07B